MHIQTENHARVPFEIGERDVDARVRVGVREVPDEGTTRGGGTRQCRVQTQNQQNAESPTAPIEPEPPRASEPKTSEPKAADASERRAPNSRRCVATLRGEGFERRGGAAAFNGQEQIVPSWEL